MKCSFCNRAFNETAARQACHRCSMFGGCRSIRCPHCGAEAPEEPGFVKWLRTKMENRRPTTPDSKEKTS